MAKYKLTWKKQPATADGYVLDYTEIDAGEITLPIAIRKMPVGDYELVNLTALEKERTEKELEAYEAYHAKALFRKKMMGNLGIQFNSKPEPELAPIMREGILSKGYHFIRIKHFYRLANTVEWGQYDRVVEENYSIRNFFIDDILKDIENV